VIDTSIVSDVTAFKRSKNERALSSRDEPSSRKPEGSTCNLVYVITALGTGGAEVGMCRLLDGLDDDRYDVTIVTLNGYDERFVDRRVPDVESILDCKQLRTPRDAVKLASVVAGADVLVGSLFHSALASRLAGVVNRDAVVATWQHNERFKTRIRKRMFGATCSLSDVVLADSAPVAEMLHEEFDPAEGFVETVPIAGVPMSEFEPRDHSATDPVVVGSVGVLSAQKNFQTLLAVADELSEERISFRVAGDGPDRRKLESRIETSGIDNVELLGEVRDLPAFLRSLDVYVQPSWFEGLCITVVEAMATGLPVVGSAVGGIEYNVIDGESGYLHEPTDVEGFCDSIRTLATDPSKRQRFGDQGREIIERNYTQEALVESFERAIQMGST
jgi:glycosyltransferase involved in cell wall biosynthesis